MKRGPNHAASLRASVRVFKPEVLENEYRTPIVIQPTIGSSNHRGTLDSLDRWVSGREMMLSSVFTTRKSWMNESNALEDTATESKALLVARTNHVLHISYQHDKTNGPNGVDVVI